jgi:ribosomal protein S12 methylthiotransferase accessory factor
MKGDDARVLEMLVTRVNARHCDVIAVSLTTPEIAALGLHVIKVFVPQAAVLNADYRYPHLAHERLYATPKLLGWRSERSEASTLNPDPHPFA